MSSHPSLLLDVPVVLRMDTHGSTKGNVFHAHQAKRSDERGEKVKGN
jgi:hypothetical protein